MSRLRIEKELSSLSPKCQQWHVTEWIFYFIKLIKFTKKNLNQTVYPRLKRETKNNRHSLM